MPADRSRLTSGCTHGKISTYSKGCRCEICRGTWRIYRRPKNRALQRAKRAAELATHPEGCMCVGCCRLRAVPASTRRM